MQQYWILPSIQSNFSSLNYVTTLNLIHQLYSSIIIADLIMILLCYLLNFMISRNLIKSHIF